MLLEHLYRISLEPKYLPVFIGTSLGLEQPQIRIDLLNSYIHGYRRSENQNNEIDEFFEWLYQRGEFPTQGWYTKFYEDCSKDHELAVEKFFSFLHEYLLEKRPKWFLSLNAKPIPSQLWNAAGECVAEDIRRKDHVESLKVLNEE